jgi:hypothetical protein
MHAEHADKSELNELSGRAIGCALTVRALGSGDILRPEIKRVAHGL